MSLEPIKTLKLNVKIQGICTNIRLPVSWEGDSDTPKDG